MTGFQSFLLINFEALTTGKPIRTLACVNSTPRVVQSSAPEIDTETMSFLHSPMETSSQLPYIPTDLVWFYWLEVQQFCVQYKALPMTTMSSYN